MTPRALAWGAALATAAWLGSCAASGWAVVRIGPRFTILPAARTAARQARGLSRRAAPGPGMLFVFPRPSRATVWMARTRFPLELAWVAHHRVVGTVPMPPCGTLPCPTWTAPVPVAAALELPGGTPVSIGTPVAWWP